MNTNGIAQKHWLRVSIHFLFDALAFGISFLIGMRLRFADDWLTAVGHFWMGITLGAVFFACAAYALGLYSLQSSKQNIFKRSVLLAMSFLISVSLMLGVFYLSFSSPIGRGALLISASITYLTVLCHHVVMLRKFRSYRERVALIVTSPLDESEIPLLRSFGGDYFNLVGIIHYKHYQPAGGTCVLGEVSEMQEIAAREDLDRILCTNQSINDSSLFKAFCQLRYSGVTVMPLISVFEEMCQCVPVELITPEWLMNASGSPHMLYIRKLKRAFDIATSLFGLLFFWPFLLFGIVLVKVASPRGPVFFRQVRTGRFGRPFELIKLRTMRLDAESGGAVWASNNDPRVIPFGKFLRRYRVDELPQLWNVLRGEMSFVGPRPERPEFVQKLSREIPFYQERFMTQPGITGWAQVNYPYGSTVEDAKHKLEYDLYYAKNMSLFLDVFVMLDTVRIILRGGLKHSDHMPTPRYQSTPPLVPSAPKPVSSAAAAVLKNAMVAES